MIENYELLREIGTWNSTSVFFSCFELCRNYVFFFFKDNAQTHFLIENFFLYKKKNKVSWHYLVKSRCCQTYMHKKKIYSTHFSIPLKRKRNCSSLWPIVMGMIWWNALFNVPVCNIDKENRDWVKRLEYDY